MTTPQPGDLLINTSGKTVIESALSSESERIVITSNVEATSLEFSRVTLNGTDLGSRIQNVRHTPGVGDSNVRGIHIASSSVLTDKLGLISTSKGGTGRGSFGANEVLFSDALAQVQSSDRFLSTSNGATVVGSVRFLDGSNATEYSQSNSSLVMDHNGDATDLSRASVGSAPTIVSMSVNKSGSDATVAYTLRDIDGDLRSLHLAWYAAAPAGVSASDVLLWTLEGGAGASGSAPDGSAEVDLVASFNSGSSTYSSTHAISGLATGPVYVHAVAEDGPGNLSELRLEQSGPS